MKINLELKRRRGKQRNHLKQAHWNEIERCENEVKRLITDVSNKEGVETKNHDNLEVPSGR